MSPDRSDPILTNREYWDHLAPVHYRAYDDIKRLRTGENPLDDIQKKELGDVRGKSVLHLQCHIGNDSICLERLGATVTAVDFSPASINIAKQLNEELGANVRFICSDIYDLPSILEKQFDVVYTSQGVLLWLRDIQRWGEIVAHFIKPGGFFYIMDTHPILFAFEDDEKNGIKLHHPYFTTGPAYWDDEWPDYADDSFINKKPCFDWTWTMSDIVNSLLKSNLSLAFLNEYHKLFYRGFTTMEKDGSGWWQLPAPLHKKLPLSFTLKAVKPST
jgi:SAM-dependent methyltransferase